ncbi:uncharacterized protein LOC134403819 [Elgaria multicarinata webbii]|uniref:uncharacterized protein LOC134403819 n=1 Tax=Elgaria multicarinata webbii TaxID=159646 RepID=UPI002FCD1BD9
MGSSGSKTGSPESEKTPLKKMCKIYKDRMPSRLNLKRLVTLCQDKWPFFTKDLPSLQWPVVGTFEPERLTHLRHYLERKQPSQMDYWFLWDDQRSRLQVESVIASQKNSLNLLKQKLGLSASQIASAPLLQPQNDQALFAHLGPLEDIRSTPSKLLPVRTYPNFADPNQAPIRAYQPWSSSDIWNLKQRLPALREDPERFIEELQNLATLYNPTALDLEDLLRMVIPKHDFDRILVAARNPNNQALTAWPANPQAGEIGLTDADLQRMRQERETLWQAIRQICGKRINMTAIRDTKQLKDESPRAYQARLECAIRKHSNLDPSDPQNAWHITDLLLNGLISEISSKIRTAVIGYREATPEEILRAATQYWDDIQERKLGKEKLETKLLTLQIEQLQTQILP